MYVENLVSYYVPSANIYRERNDTFVTSPTI